MKLVCLPIFKELSTKCDGRYKRMCVKTRIHELNTKIFENRCNKLCKKLCTYPSRKKSNAQDEELPLWL